MLVRGKVRGKSRGKLLWLLAGGSLVAACGARSGDDLLLGSQATGEVTGTSTSGGADFGDATSVTGGGGATGQSALVTGTTAFGFMSGNVNTTNTSSISGSGFGSPGSVTGFSVTGVTGSSTGGNCIPGSCQCFTCQTTCTCNGYDPLVCEAWCSQTTGSVGFASVTGTFSVVSGSASTTGSGGSGGMVGNCCQPANFPGCVDPGVMSCVCNVDPYCCRVAWDGACVTGVEQYNCGSCSGGAGGATAVSVSGFSSAGGAGGTTSSGTTGEGGGGGIAECVAQSETECEACLCSGCFTQYGTCIADFGCPVILQCFDATGCTGSDCYLPDTCQPTIDQFGGLTGASLRYALGLIRCATGNACPCE